MVNTDCPRIEELADIADLVADDPRRRHVEKCPRCRSRLSTCREFLAGRGECEAGQLDRALDSLGTDLDREIFGKDVRPVAPTSPPRLRWRSPFVRGGLAVAASILLFFALDGARETIGPGEIRLRSDRPDPETGELVLEATLPLADGGLEFNWRPLAGADGYRLEILDARLEPLAALPVTPGHSLALSADQLREILPESCDFVWVVVALRGEDTILRSAPATFSLGPEP